LDELGDTIRISDSDAIAVARMINQKGLSVGISSGANLLAAAKKCLELGKDSIVGTIFCDDNKKYLSTDLCSGSDEILSCGLEILNYRRIS
jgi:cysteine synthase A